MSDFVNEVIRTADILRNRIEKNKKIIVLADLLKREKYDKAVSVFEVQAVINRCLQCGNYKRACRYIFIARKMLEDIEVNERHVVERLTEIVLNDE